MIKSILGSLLLVAATSTQAADKTENRAFTAQETAAKNAVAASGMIQLSMKMANRIITSGGRERKLIVTSRGHYRLVEGSASECQSPKMQDMQVDSGYFASKTEISQYGIMYELCQDEAEEIEIPRLSYVRYTDSGLFSSKEVICYYELSSAAIIPAIDVSLVMSNMASEIPIQIGLVGEHAPNEISMDIGLSTVGWHGTYPSCQTPNCAIPAQLGQKTSVLLKYVPENASTSSAKPAAGS